MTLDRRFLVLDALTLMERYLDNARSHLRAVDTAGKRYTRATRFTMASASAYSALCERMIAARAACNEAWEACIDLWPVAHEIGPDFCSRDTWDFWREIAEDAERRSA